MTEILSILINILLSFSGDLSQALAKCPHLQALNLHCNGPLITDKDLETISRYCSKLTELDLAKCNALTDQGFVHLRRLPALTCLNLSHTGITDDGLERLFVNWPASRCLKELRVDNCAQVTDYGIEVVLETCQDHLNIFLFHNCPRTTSRSQIALQEFLQNKPRVKQTTWTIY